MSPARRHARTLRRFAALVTLAAVGTMPAAAQEVQVPQEEYNARRDSLAAKLNDGLLVAFGGRTPVSDYGPFFQLPDFRYLTNYNEPDAALVMVIRGGRTQSTLYITQAGARQAFYYGKRPDSLTVERTLGMRARAAGVIEQVLDSLAGSVKTVYTLADFAAADFATQDSLTRGQQWERRFAAKHPAITMRDAHPYLYQLRAKKSAAEMALIRKAAEISAEGHRAAMRLSQPSREYELQAALEYEFMRLGGARPSYGSIVGGGQRGTQLHYMRNRGELKPGDMVVLDAATEYEGYAADVTRSIPVGGTFSPEQREMYQLVLDAQLAAERNSKVGMSSIAAQDSSEDVRARGLARLGLIEGVDATIDMPWRTDCANSPRSCRQSMFWMIHGISHGIGLAVHDPAQFYSGNRTFKVGDSFTIEPGIYISTAMLESLPDTPKNRAFIAKVKAAVLKYENTGIRIEDDYIVTEKGTERISTGAPREIAEIEALMRNRARVVP
ncbi:MAG TPA: aminopeptidase P N-terminal domain-containing protein [Gemmatimonadaceae bacterium]|nr:aminopeptidase P N-terminal domain-containing protein [Gemmatimonadaceae bacterium]